MAITLTSARSIAGLSATAASAKPATSWKEPVGRSGWQFQLASATACREIKLTLGASGNSAAGALAGLWTVTGSTTGTQATGTLTLAANAADGEKVTIGTTVYTFKTTPAIARQVKVGATASDSIDNLIAAINAAAGAGTLYGTGTTAHALVTAAAGAGDTMVVTAIANHSSGNSIATTETMASGSWGAATLAGGVTPCSIEGETAYDITGDALASVTAVDGLEIVVHSGRLEITCGTKVTSLSLDGPSVFHISGDVVSALGTITLAAAAADTVATLTALWH